ncbi:MAG: hypothetical protein JSS82_17230 [Bacteroidetes bacterium]|nr:hypothetical protein [Bacteroidota bacterium]
MNRVLSQKLMFISKSLLWSVLFYAVLMTIINWDEVSNRFGKSDKQVASAHTSSAPISEPVVDAKAAVIPGRMRKDIQLGNEFVAGIKSALSRLKSAADILP